MKKCLLMDCQSVLETVFEAEKLTQLPFTTQLQITVHCLFCPDCATALNDLRQAEIIMHSDFFPPSPHFGDALMERIHDERIEHVGNEEIFAQEGSFDPARFSLRAWVLTGCFVLLSLTSVFFGMHFTQIVNATGLSFLLPVGITVGVVLTCYGAFFIGSHLDELSARFGLR